MNRMTKQDALNKLNSYVENKRKQEEMYLDSKSKELNRLMNEINQLSSRIKDLHDIIMHTSKLKIANGQFFTNGIDHNLGFFTTKIIVGHLFCQKNNCYEPNEYFGIKGGGCCGFDLKIGVNNGFITYSNPQDNAIYSKDCLNKMRAVIKCFSRYEEEVYSFIQNL